MKRNHRSIILTLLSLLLALVASCSWISRKGITSQYYKDRGELIVVTKNSPVSYFEDRTGATVGYEHDILTEFASSMKVNVRFVVKENTKDVLDELRLGGAHLAAAAIEGYKAHASNFLIGPSLAETNTNVVCHKGLKSSKPTALAGKKVVIVIDDEENKSLSSLKLKYPEIDWVDDEDSSLQHWVEATQEKRVDCFITSSLLLESNQVSLANLRIPVDIGEKEELGWLIAKGQKRLAKDLKSWMENKKNKKLVEKISQKYFGNASTYSLYDTEIFLKRIKSRLPDFKGQFLELSKRVDLDWRLLAAVGYQESHWNPEARSPTGVRGLMMLTKQTAKEMGVTNRLDPNQSIDGGSRYLRRMLDRIPQHITGQDRLWFALAAYNVGWSHLADARKLSIDKAKDPNKWDDLKVVLPLLARAKYYKKLQHGYARGHEPVHYVSRIKRYYDLLKIEFPSANY